MVSSEDLNGVLKLSPTWSLDQCGRDQRLLRLLANKVVTAIQKCEWRP